MHARDETILFSAIAILLVTLALGGLADLVSPDARAFSAGSELQASQPAGGSELHASRSTVCIPAAATPAVRTGAEQRS